MKQILMLLLMFCLIGCSTRVVNTNESEQSFKDFLEKVRADDKAALDIVSEKDQIEVKLEYRDHLYYFKYLEKGKLVKEGCLPYLVKLDKMGWVLTDNKDLSGEEYREYLLSSQSNAGDNIGQVIHLPLVKDDVEYPLVNESKEYVNQTNVEIFYEKWRQSPDFNPELDKKYIRNVTPGGCDFDLFEADKLYVLKDGHLTKLDMESPNESAFFIRYAGINTDPNHGTNVFYWAMYPYSGIYKAHLCAYNVHTKQSISFDPTFSEPCRIFYHNGLAIGPEYPEVLARIIFDKGRPTLVMEKK